MTGTFKTNNPVNIVFLLGYAFVLKWHSFFYPHVPVPQATDGFLYIKLLNFISPAGQVLPVIYPLIVLVLTLTQAITLNSIINNEKLLPKPNYLPAMAYMLIISLFPEWWQLSPALVINSLLIGVWGLLSRLFNHPRAKTQIFNAGLIVGLASFLYFPAIGFAFLLFFAIMTIRPFHLSEWLVGILGLLTPYYFLFAILFLSNAENPLTYLPSIAVSIPVFQQDLWGWAAVLLLVIPFLISGFYIQGNILRMLITARKCWNLLLFYLLIALLVPVINFTSTFEYWSLCAVPFAAFHSYTYFFATRKQMAAIIHWVLVTFILALNFWVSYAGPR